MRRWEGDDGKVTGDGLSESRECVVNCAKSATMWVIMSTFNVYNLFLRALLVLAIVFVHVEIGLAEGVSRPTLELNTILMDSTYLIQGQKKMPLATSSASGLHSLLANRLLTEPNHTMYS
jgi:hypothetical protein